MRAISTKKKMVLGVAFAVVMLFACLIPIQPASAAWPFPPVPVDGRILTPNLTGDTSDWVEIARYGNYSLIVRKNFINIYSVSVVGNKVVYNDPMYQRTNFGSNTNYMVSFVRTKINEWFNGNAPITSQADRLPWFARLRNYTMLNNASYTPGTSTTHMAVINGFSTPINHQQGMGLDIAFALSYGEAANFLSITHYLRNNFINGVYVAQQPSNPFAVRNYNKISIPVGTTYLAMMWLRSPGDTPNTAATIESKHHASVAGRVFQMSIGAVAGRSDYGLVYPALWVDQGIFGTPLTAKITVRHRDAVTQALLEPEEVYTVPAPGNYGPYNAKTFAGYGPGTLAPGSAPASGTVNANDSRIITYQYNRSQQPVQLQVVYIPNGGTGTTNLVNVNANTYYIVVDQGYTRPGMRQNGWNTQPDGTGTQYMNGSAVLVNSVIILYAQWF